MGDQSFTVKLTFTCMLIFEIIMMILFGIFVKYRNVYGEAFISTTESTGGTESTGEPEAKAEEHIIKYDVPYKIDPNMYSMFQNIQVMVFVGFGFLMTYLKKYARSTLGFSFILSSIVIQWYILIDGFINFEGGKFIISLESIINGDVAAVVFLISFGAVLGQFTPFQAFIMAVIETVFYMTNKYIFEDLLKAMDVGGSMFIHEFGAFFGIGASFFLGLRKGVQETSSLEGSSYTSDVTSMLGTLFLWMFWPSFNAVLSPGNSDVVILNTYLSLCASVVTAAATTGAVSRTWKFNMMLIQNATLAGGVGIGTSCNLNIKPVGALAMGGLSGIISVLSYRYIRDPINEKLRIHDTMGVLHLHGIPGLLGGLMGAITALFPSKMMYNNTHSSIYPEVANSNRKEIMQAVYQLIGLFGTLAMALAGGLLSGAFASYLLPTLSPDERYDDDIWWEDEDGSTPPA